MEFWQRQRIGMLLGQIATTLLLAIVFYRPGLPSRRLFGLVLMPLGMLALVFVPIVAGLYLARRKATKI